MAHNVQVSPFTFGYKYNITDALAVDAHLGAYVSCDYVGKIKEKESYQGDSEETSVNMGDWEDWKRVDAGMNQRGFIKTWECNTSNVLIRLGVAF